MRNQNLFLRAMLVAVLLLMIVLLFGTITVFGDGANANQPVMNTTTSNPLASPPEAGGDYKIFCYYTRLSWYRKGTAKFLPENIDPSLCSHVIYAFTMLDPDTLEIKSFDPHIDINNGLFTKVSSLSSKGVKVLLGLGGWGESASDKYSRLVNNISARNHFTKQAISFVEKYKFQGLDLDWEYPKCWQANCHRGLDSDKAGFSALVSELSLEFKKREWILTAAVSKSKKIIDQAYDVPVLAKSLDWILIMGYNYHGKWNTKTGHLSPLYKVDNSKDLTKNLNFTINYWIEKGAPPKKLVLGMPLYGISFTLSNATEHGMNAPVSGPGMAGEVTKSPGILAFYEICQNLSKGGWMVVNETQGKISPYAYKDNQWLSYDNQDSIRIKSKFIKNNNLGGGMIWALDYDDFKNSCGFGNYPLLNTLNEALRG